MESRVVFERVSVRAFRNIASIEFSPSPHVNVISGDNGQGKTSLIEALYVVATSKSFRTERLREVIREDQPTATIRAALTTDALSREQRVALTPRGRSLTIDGKRPERLSAYALRTPVVAFHPGDLTLISGSAKLRRTLLDRVALFTEPSSADARSSYLGALKRRQRTLEERGLRAGELDAFEVVAAEHGARFARSRRRAAEEVALALGPAFQRMAASDLALAVHYQAGGSEDVETFRAALAHSRPADLRRRAATYGPQRDELELTIDGRSARKHASQGQQRILTLALKVAELDCIRQASGTQPALLLDDVSSELDPERTGAVYAFLRNQRSQVFVTTTRPELFVTPELGPDARADWRMLGGALVPPQA